MTLQIRGLAVLLLATVLWGSTFVVIKSAIATVPPDVVIWIRFTLAALVFAPFLQRNLPLWRGGLEVSFWLLAGYATQTIGLQYTTASRSAFITALNIIFLPLLLGAWGHQVKRATWISAAIAFTGIGLLSYSQAVPNIGDLWSLLSALCWAVYIWRLEAQAYRYSAFALTAVQTLGIALGALLWVGVSDRPWLSVEVLTAQVPWQSLLYLGLVTTALTTWMQTWGQSQVSAPEAAVIYALEPVWGAFFAYVALNEMLGMQGLFGAGLVAIAIVVNQLPAWRQRHILEG